MKAKSLCLSKKLQKELEGIDLKKIDSPTGEINKEFEVIVDYKISDDLKRLFGLKDSIREGLKRLFTNVCHGLFFLAPKNSCKACRARQEELKEVDQIIWDRICSEAVKIDPLVRKSNVGIYKDWKLVRIDEEKKIAYEKRSSSKESLEEIVFGCINFVIDIELIGGLEDFSKVIDEHLDEVCGKSDYSGLFSNIENLFEKKVSKVLKAQSRKSIIGTFKDLLEEVSQVLEFISFRF